MIWMPSIAVAALPTSGAYTSVQQSLRNVDHAAGVNADQIGVVGGMMDIAQRLSVGALALYDAGQLSDAHELLSTFRTRTVAKQR
ncbi:hypothetical protein [Bradyrhizobium sp. USDA 4504]